MFAKLHLFSQDVPEKSDGLRWRAHPYLRMAGALLKGPAVFDWSERQHADLDALWRDPDSEGARERLAEDLAVFCERLGWTVDAQVLEDADKRGGEYMLTLSAVPPELYVLPWEVIRIGETGTYLADHESAQVRYAIPGLPAREVQTAPPRPGVLFAWSSAGGEVPHTEQAAAIRAAAAAGGVSFRELADVSEASLQAALDAGPPSVLHLLCHGVAGSDGEPSGLKWGTLDQPSEISAPRLAKMLRHHDGALRLVVLSACGSGDGRGDPLLLGSLAQELHRNGVRSVVASRYPLSVPGSQVMTRALYDKMLGEAWSLERALRHTRQALLRVGGDGEAHPGDAYGIQLYAYDAERFASDNGVEAERPVLASYPFGTAACPVPAKGPPRVELTLKVDAGAALSRKQLTRELQRVSEDDRLTVAIAPGGEAGASELKVLTTVDGSQRLLRRWWSKALPVAIGMLVLDLAKTANASPLPPIPPAVPQGLAGTLGKVAATAGKAIGAKAAIGLIGVVTAVAVTAAVVHSQPTVAQPQVVHSQPSVVQPRPSEVHPQPSVEHPQPPVVYLQPVVYPQPPVVPRQPEVHPPPPPHSQPPPVCGNGRLEHGEQCDDGNRVDGDGCSSTCQREALPVCGNGKLERGEECDDGNTLDADGCSSTCQIEPPACGNGKVEAGEQCDDGNTADGDGCSSTCQREAPSVCGNGKLERGEQCDDGNRVDGDGCSPTCRIEADPLIHISDKLQRVAGKVNIRPSQPTRSSMERAGVTSVTGLFEVCISRDGSVTSAAKKQSTGYDDYDAKLIRAIHDWRYQPHMINGAPAPVCSTVEYVFQLQ